MPGSFLLHTANLQGITIKLNGESPQSRKPGGTLWIIVIVEDAAAILLHILDATSRMERNSSWTARRTSGSAKTSTAVAARALAARREST